MTEFTSRNHGHSCFEVIIKTTDPEHYKASEELARRLIDLAKPVTDNNVGCKWIPVTERLPEKWRETDEKYFGDPIEFIVHIAGAECATTLCFDGKDFFDITTGESYTVTHWMPLPEPPKEEDQ